MPRYDHEFSHHLETLRCGGLEAVFLFVDVAKEFHEKGHDQRVSNWIGIAIANLPEADRPSALTLLLRELSRKKGKAQLHLVQPDASIVPSLKDVP